MAETSGLASLAGQTAATAAEAEAPEEEFSVGNFVGEVYDSMSPLDKAALFTAPVPILGDIVGFVADGAALYDDPSRGGALRRPQCNQCCPDGTRPYTFCSFRRCHQNCTESFYQS